MAERKCSIEGKDTVFLGPQVSEDGSRAAVRHTKDHQWQQGVLTPVKEGQPLNPNFPCLALDRQEDGSYSAEEVFGGKPQESDSGPAMVNSNDFRNGWDRIFGNRTVGVA